MLDTRKENEGINEFLKTFNVKDEKKVFGKMYQGYFDKQMA